MFPLKDDLPTQRVAVITRAIVLLNVASWIFVQGAGSRGPLIHSICRFGITPALFIARFTGHLDHVLSCPPVLSVGPVALLTSMFMHGSWLHLLANMWFLHIFGDNVEEAMGRGWYVIFYVLSGVVAASVELVSLPDSTIPMVGASGAISAVMGAYLMLFPRALVQTGFVILVFFRVVPVPAWLVLLLWLLLQLLTGTLLRSEASPNAVWVHVAGFVVGGLVGGCLALVRKVRTFTPKLQEHGV